MLQGATILDQCVHIQPWGAYINESNPWNSLSSMLRDDTSSLVRIDSSRSIMNWLLGS